ncbi:Hsp20/alpha crystallin family protein [Patescibacteria group bacterium]|nr:Hsp20/alpha crystallin family protein [Patescibacteria group bacterium]MDE1946719.1 Hsp20/alpha crystallin family protein [Patescibacteria group bacterium]MDE2010978.1 Hsp20/alpha crystallin family protein [Patescibacteria group bacterium]MDE2232821.1 Hsp20/alpha crystallin family protein [Patescibacteria group bacterium]
MTKDKRTFFERLTGAVRMNGDEHEPELKPSKKNGGDLASWIDEETEKEGELTVDVYQTPDSIVIKSMIAGVRPEDLDVTITRDLVTIRGKREEERIENDDDYFLRELYWGSFSRTVQLPEEIDVDEAEAVEKHGLLILMLPKLDKKKQSKLKVRTA